MLSHHDYFPAHHRSMLSAVPLSLTRCISYIGLILAYGIIVVIGGTNDLAGAALGVDTADDIGGSDGVFPPIVWLLAQLTVTLFGLVSVFLGFQVCVLFVLSYIHTE